MRSLYISRMVYNRPVYKAFKNAYNTLYCHGNDLERHHAHFYRETGCRVVKIQHDYEGHFKNATIEFEHDSDYTMFMLKWAL